MAVLKRLASAVVSPYMRSERLRRTGFLGLCYNRLVNYLPYVARMVNPWWSVERTYEDLLLLRSEDGTRLWLDKDYASILLRESQIWPLVYLPSFSLAGLTVLDVGAGQGESADFYFRNGAAKVVCVEMGAANCALIETNAEMNGWDVKVISSAFELGHLKIPHDFLKMDIEGGELLLLDPTVEALGPCRMEVHPSLVGWPKTDDLIAKFGLKSHDQPDMMGRDD